jgi:TctA family transporter
MKDLLIAMFIAGSVLMIFYLCVLGFMYLVVHISIEYIIGGLCFIILTWGAYEIRKTEKRLNRKT